MLSKNQIKLIKQLNQKKYRNQNNLFFAEGVKTVNEFIKAGFTIRSMFATDQYQNSRSTDQIHLISSSELTRISNLKTPNQVLCVFEIPEERTVKRNGFTLVLDDINDPGNLGTIIRLCDWFGVDQLVCSKNTVDCYNPKTVQASMGSLARTDIVYTDLEEFLKNDERIIYGSFMQGENIYNSRLPENAVLIMGNEANGISKNIEKLIRKKITIPQFGKIQETESLNVAMAAAVLLSEFKRNTRDHIQIRSD
jgi:TrmH family RNA methyltransferase